MTGSITTDAAARKAAPLAEGCLWYFPNALMAVAAVSLAGNRQHNGLGPIYHARGKSGDHADALLRHLLDAGKIDDDGIAHTAKMAWRALALLQEEIERLEGAPLPRNARPAMAPDRIVPTELRWPTIGACQITGETEPLPTSAQWPQQNNRFVL